MKKILCLCLVLALLPICGMAEIVSLDEQVDQIFRDAKTVGGATKYFVYNLSLIHI